MLSSPSAYALARSLKTFLNRYGRKLLTAGLVLGSLATLGFLIARDWDALRQFRWHLRPSLLILALCCHMVSLAGTFVAWELIMHQLGSPTGLRTDFHIFFLSLAAKKMPSVIWYTGTRLFLYAQEKINAALVLSAIALEFGIAVLTGGWTFVAFQTRYLFMEDYVWVGHGVLVITLVLTSLFIVRPRLFIRWVQGGKRGRDNSLLVITSNRSGLLICSLIYVVAWIVGGTSFYLTIWALVPNPGIDWINAVGVATLSTLVVLLGSVLPMGIGLKELASGFLLSIWLPMPIGLSIAVVYRLLQMFDEALWIGAAYFLRPKTPEHLILNNPKGVLH